MAIATEQFQHLTQQGNGWSNDCGPACVLINARALGMGQDMSVRALAERVDRTQDGTDAPNLVAAFALLGLPAEIGAVYPCIVAVDYGQVPRELKAPGYLDATFIHWVFGLSSTEYLDPLHTNPSRGRLTIDASAFARANASAIARAKRAGYDCRNVGVIERTALIGESTMQTSGKAVIRWQSWNVRADTSLKFGAPAGARLGQLENGQQFTVLRELVVDGVTFGEIDLAAGGAELRQVDKARLPQRAYVLKKNGGWTYVDTTPQAPPVPAGVIGTHPALPNLAKPQLMGIHMLNRGKPMLDEWINAGVRSFTVMDNVAAGREARAAGAAVIYRRYIDHGVVPNARDFVRFMGLSRDDTMMVMGVNEADSISTSDLLKRFAWDREFAQAVWDNYPKCFPVIGSFSMGTPQLENPAVARIWRETYGAFLNANWHRCGLNYHSYSHRASADMPPADATVIEERWFGARFIEFGYDPNLGALDKRVILVADESGKDVGGRGGFIGCGDTEDTFDTWWTRRMALNLPHEQVYVFNLFQGDPDNKRWGSYNARSFMGRISRIVRGGLPLPAIPRMIAGWRDGAAKGAVESPLAQGWQPAAKKHR